MAITLTATAPRQSLRNNGGHSAFQRLKPHNFFNADVRLKSYPVTRSSWTRPRGLRGPQVRLDPSSSCFRRAKEVFAVVALRQFSSDLLKGRVAIVTGFFTSCTA